MICVNITDNGQVQPYWQGEEAPLILKATAEGVSMTFTHEFGGEEIEVHFHPALIKMLQGWIDAQPENTFMAKEGKAKMIAEMEASDKEWQAKQLAMRKQGVVPPPF